ncbi:MAG: hypothetical protein EAZ42_02650 [Verrucomicrobia bacterium]|nr:MAG: hypothetical protein EAZ42_02650 [Verrucomicrobiota bacterium]
MKQSVTIDWALRESTRAKIKSLRKQGNEPQSSGPAHGEGIFNPLAEDWEVHSLVLCKGVANPFSLTPG